MTEKFVHYGWMNISLTHILFVLMIFQLLFLSLFLLTQEKGKRISNILLGLFFLSIALNLLDFFLFNLGVYSTIPWLAGWGSCLPLLFGPFIYLYTQSVLYKDFMPDKKCFIHFLPFVIFFSGTEIYYLIQPKAVQEQILTNLLAHHIPVSVSLVSTIIFLQFLYYIIASFRSVTAYQREAHQYVSSKSQYSVSWLSSTILFFLLIIGLNIVNGLLAQTVLAPYYLIGFNLIMLALLIFVMTVFLKALKMPYFFSFSGEEGGISQIQTPPQNLQNPSEKEEKEKIVRTIQHYMQNGKPWLEPELTVYQLASRLSLKPRLLSQAINDILGQNFYDFINRYRIEEASRLLTHPKDDKITILEVLYEVGFNSKSSFNTLFKKYTGLTPTAFRKKQSRANLSDSGG
jgi:AraC-like DNA-binding protein